MKRADLEAVTPAMLAAYLEKTGWVKDEENADWSYWWRTGMAYRIRYPLKVWSDYGRCVQSLLVDVADHEHREPWQVLRTVLGKPSVEELEAENARLRKLFDDAGQGEHNVLALIDHYQECELEAWARARDLEAEVGRLRTENAEHKEAMAYVVEHGFVHLLMAWTEAVHFAGVDVDVRGEKWTLIAQRAEGVTVTERMNWMTAWADGWAKEAWRWCRVARCMAPECWLATCHSTATWRSIYDGLPFCDEHVDMAGAAKPLPWAAVVEET